MDQLKVIDTDDQSKTLFLNDLNESYHSRYGAFSESVLVFITNGLLFSMKQKKENNLHILEFGFGTGLNALVTFKHKSNFLINYETLELYPLDWKVVSALNYTDLSELTPFSKVFQDMHCSAWGAEQPIHPQFHLRKLQTDFRAYTTTPSSFDLIYFDAFSPEKQPELWTKEVFRNAVNFLKPGGVLVTYSSKGSVKQALRDVGFTVYRLSGGKGKRHVVRAVKQ